mmetsp:Transcript_107416/g.321224  ORF Transcript_107416/g.321224 Transcript_107416/m.321224 type:complete len:205 (-) Transcript_107416:958-1572(-)
MRMRLPGSPTAWSGRAAGWAGCGSTGVRCLLLAWRLPPLLPASPWRCGRHHRLGRGERWSRRRRGRCSRTLPSMPSGSVGGRNGPTALAVRGAAPASPRASTTAAATLPVASATATSTGRRRRRRPLLRGSRIARTTWTGRSWCSRQPPRPCRMPNMIFKLPDTTSWRPPGMHSSRTTRWSRRRGRRAKRCMPQSTRPSRSCPS